MLASLWSLACWLRGGRVDWPPVAADADADADALSWSLSDAMAAVVFALAGPHQARLLNTGGLAMALLSLRQRSCRGAAEELQKSCRRAASVSIAVMRCDAQSRAQLWTRRTASL